VFWGIYLSTEIVDFLDFLDGIEVVNAWIDTHFVQQDAASFHCRIIWLFDRSRNKTGVNDVGTTLYC
jgi:hypothetical protein